MLIKRKACKVKVLLFHCRVDKPWKWLLEKSTKRFKTLQQILNKQQVDLTLSLSKQQAGLTQNLNKLVCYHKLSVRVQLPVLPADLFIQEAFINIGFMDI